MNLSFPLLSVVVPIYGVEKYLDECIRSIINQTYQNLEILLIDDGSKGSEPEICDAYAQRDNRIKVIHKQNEGLVAARKTGIKNASGCYITFIDGDDYIAPEQYSRMMKWMIDESPDMVITSLTQVTNGIEKQCSQLMPDGIYENARLTYLLENMNCYKQQYYKCGILPSTCLKIYKSELLRSSAYSIPNNIRMGEDAAFTYPYLLNCNKVVVDNSIYGYYYRTVTGSMSKSTDDSLFYGSSSLYNYLKPYYEHNVDSQVMTQLELFRIYLADIALGYWMSNTKLCEIPKTNKHIKQLIAETSLFNDLTPSLNFSLPQELKTNLTLINQSKWRIFGLRWMKESLLSYLLTMAKKMFGKA